MSNDTIVRWSQIQRTEQFQGCWVALDNCKYDHVTRQPTEGDVVDSDEDLTDLCRRMREMGRSSCSVLFCSGDVFIEQPGAPEASETPTSLGVVTNASSSPSGQE